MRGVRFIVALVVFFTLAAPSFGADIMLGDSALDIVRQGGQEVNAGHLDAAQADFDRAISIDPNCTPAYLSRAELRFQSGDLPGGLSDLNRAIETDPHSESSFRYYIYRGSARKQVGDLVDARADFSQAIILKPDLGAAYKERGPRRTGIG